MKKSILFVDDEQVILQSFCYAFNQLGYETTASISGEDALKMLANNKYDAVVTDLKMPGISGVKVLEKVRVLNPDAIGIILTGHGDLSSAMDSLRLGVDDYLLKPCEIDELDEKLTICFEKQKNKKTLLRQKERADHCELVTTLSNGLMHDYNNLLAQILGSLELAATVPPGNEKSATYLQWGLSACELATELT